MPLTGVRRWLPRRSGGSPGRTTGGRPGVRVLTTGNTWPPGMLRWACTLPRDCATSPSAPASQPVAEPVTVTVARVVPARAARGLRALGGRGPGAGRDLFPGTGLVAAAPGAGGATSTTSSTGSPTTRRWVAWERSDERQEALARCATPFTEEERFARAVGPGELLPAVARATGTGLAQLLAADRGRRALLCTSTFQPLVAVPFVGSWPWPARLLLSAVFVVSALRRRC